jgi:cytidyltransferase-like protein
MREKKVLVSGCFDLLHAGHVAFLNEAATYGRLYVSVGTDKNLELLKQQAAYFKQEERVYVIENIRCVEKAFLASGSGMLDFAPDLERIRPDYFIVNEDGHTPDKKRLCKKLGIEYVVLKRTPAASLPPRASSQIKKDLKFPYRIALAGGWIDQPWVSEVCSGSMVVASIYPTLSFHDRSGMATSSRKIAIELWGDRLPCGRPERMAELLFGAENPPGSEYVSGSQDHLGLLLPGISKLYYAGKYWPEKIDSTRDKETCRWLENVLHLVPLKPRPMGYDPLEVKKLGRRWVKQLGDSGEACYASILKRDVAGLGASLRKSLEAWQKILPKTVPDSVLQEIRKYSSFPGATFSGAGGGYVIVASEKKIEGALKIRIRY